MKMSLEIIHEDPMVTLLLLCIETDVCILSYHVVKHASPFRKEELEGPGG